jgi:hypothetical protein
MYDGIDDTHAVHARVRVGHDRVDHLRLSHQSGLATTLSSPAVVRCEPFWRKLISCNWPSSAMMPPAANVLRIRMSLLRSFRGNDQLRSWIPSCVDLRSSGEWQDRVCAKCDFQLVVKQCLTHGETRVKWRGGGPIQLRLWQKTIIITFLGPGLYFVPGTLWAHHCSYQWNRGLRCLMCGIADAFACLCLVVEAYVRIRQIPLTADTTPD